MRWQDLKVVAKEISGTDYLNNPEYIYSEFSTIPGRFSPWTAEDIEIEGRELTENARKIVTPTERSFFRNAAEIWHTEGEGDDAQTHALEITDVKDLGRFRILIVKEYRAWKAKESAST